jgi:hypothetical protein
MGPLSDRAHWLHITSAPGLGSHLRPLPARMAPFTAALAWSSGATGLIVRACTSQGFLASATKLLENTDASGGVRIAMLALLAAYAEWNVETLESVVVCDGLRQALKRSVTAARLTRADAAVACWQLRSVCAACVAGIPCQGMPSHGMQGHAMLCHGMQGRFTRPQHMFVCRTLRVACRVLHIACCTSHVACCMLQVPRDGRDSLR